jgi:hypothetical protein
MTFIVASEESCMDGVGSERKKVVGSTANAQSWVVCYLLYPNVLRGVDVPPIPLT